MLLCVCMSVCVRVCVCVRILQCTLHQKAVFTNNNHFVSFPSQDRNFTRDVTAKEQTCDCFFFLFSVCLDQYRKDDQRKHLTTTFPPIFASFTSEGSIVTCCVFLGGFSKLKFTHPLGCILVLDSACHHECFVSISVTNALERNLKVWNVSLLPQKQLPGGPVLVVVKQ